MAALDDPERYTFVRNGRTSGVNTAPKTMADWTKCLEGPALARRMAASFTPPAWRQRRERERQEKPQGLRPGLTRNGRSIPDAGH